LFPEFFARAAAGVDFDAFVDDEFFFIDFVFDHQRAHFLCGRGLGGHGDAHQKGSHYQCFRENVFQHSFVFVYWFVFPKSIAGWIRRHKGWASFNSFF
jgi:hypothetical protein